MSGVLYRGTREAQVAFVRLVVAAGKRFVGVARMTSYYRPGDTASQHGVGTAIDFGVRTPAEAAAARAIAAQWRAWGLTAIEETGAEPGSTGPHVHLQLFPKGAQSIRY